MNYLLVFFGGGLGSVCRYLIGIWLMRHHHIFPWATLVANALSCILFGAIVAFFAKGQLLDPRYKLLLLTGFCGGFSTFSTFTNETWVLYINQEWLYAFANVLSSVLICLFCLYLGMQIVNWL